MNGDAKGVSAVASGSNILIWCRPFAICVPPILVISAATKTNAEILGVFANRGSLESGKQADILVVAGNPLADIKVLGRATLVAKDGALWVSENVVLQVGGPINRFHNP